jgi:hypothetical protein
MFVNADPAVMAFTATATALISAIQASADASAAGVHGALLPPSLDPTAVLNTTVHQLDHAQYQLHAGLGTANEAMIASTLGISGATYAAGEAANAVAML